MLKLSAVFKKMLAPIAGLSVKARWWVLASFLGGMSVHMVIAQLTTGGKTLESQTVKAERTVPVGVEAVQKRTIKSMFSTHAYLQPWKEVILRPNSNVNVRTVNVKIGMQVRVGDVLATTGSESQALRAELDALDRQIRNLDFNVTRALAKKSFLSHNEFTQKELEHRASKIRARLTEIETTGSMIAPVAGVISDLNLKAGDYIDNPGPYFIKIADASQLKIQLYLPQNLAAKINAGTTAVLSRTSNDDDGHEAKVETPAVVKSVAPVVDPKTGSVYVEIATDKVPNGWLAGMYVEVGITAEQSVDVPSVPNDSIVYENNKPFVFQVMTPEPADEQDRSLASSDALKDQPAQGQTAPPEQVPAVRKAAVALGLKDSQFTEIVSGVDEQDLVVVEGQGALTDGAKVEVVR